MPQGRSSEQAAALLNISPTSIKVARRVLRSGAPNLIRAVESGALAVSAASKQLAATRPVRRRKPLSAEAALRRLWGPLCELARTVRDLDKRRGEFLAGDLSLEGRPD